MYCPRLFVHVHGNKKFMIKARQAAVSNLLRSSYQQGIHMTCAVSIRFPLAEAYYVYELVCISKKIYMEYNLIVL